jgi:LmbE family N-acetylglucosaminyl deacetylase
MNPYQAFASEFVRLLREGGSLPFGGMPAPQGPRPKAGAPAGLIFSPHPDDECIIGGWALRLMRQAGLRIINIAVTLGSKANRREARWQELSRGCSWIGFELEAAAPGGLEGIDPQTRQQQPEHWAEAVLAVASLLRRHQPRVIFFPHELDWNTTHIGTHLLVMDALKAMPDDFQCFLAETEFWGQMPSPNLMVALGIDEVADLLAALSFHVGEVQRNPYHLRMPAWLLDNVRRGAELVGGQGGAAPVYPFATLYRLRRWSGGRIEAVMAGGREIRLQDAPEALLNDGVGSQL